MRIKTIRNATIALDYSGSKILIDPYFAAKFSLPSNTGKSKNPTTDLPMSLPEIMENVKYVLVSHLHSDHFDMTARQYIVKSMPVICQTENESEIRNMGFRDIRPIHKKYQLGSIEMNRIIGKHGEGEVLKKMGVSSGFYFSSDDECDLYWIGDTILCDSVIDVLLKRKPKIVIAHSAGATGGTNMKIIMDEVQTIEVCKMLPESIVIATHMDSLDHITVTRKQLREYADKNNVSREQLIIPEDGEENVFIN
ncbi:MAG: Zn-dependent hydrolase [Marinilabiliales bacterium]|nr:MAG: Zn-dependent hydrolase [Marinilabiliales bacterium]